MSLKTDYDEKGFVVLEDFFSPAEVLKLVEHVDQIHEQWLEEHNDEVIEQELVNMHSLTRAEYFKDDPARRVSFFEALAPAKLTELLAEIFDEPIYFHNTQLFFNPHNIEQQPYWHRDLQFSPVGEELQKTQLPLMTSLHVRIPLVKEQGIELIPGTHKRWDTPKERQVRLELDGHENSEDLPESELIDLHPGDLVIFSAHMIHRGNYAANESRKALDLCVGAYHELVSDTLDAAVLPTPEELAEISDNEWYVRAWEVIESRRKAS